jgi:hypothetical protein
MILESVGYLGSVLVAVSLMMSNIRRLRWINLVGAAVFSIYGALIAAWPVFALNGFIALVDLWFLIQMNRQNEYFSLLDVQGTPTPYLRHFLEFHQVEIRAIFPHFELAETGLEGWWILRNVQPVGLFLHTKESEQSHLVLLDFVIPEYRDMKNARWFFQEGMTHLGTRGEVTLRAESTYPAHMTYLKRMGFTTDDSHEFTRTQRTTNESPATS